MTTPSRGREKSVVVVGAGGNTGSHLLPHLARSGAVVRFILIDRDKYDETNLLSQNISFRDIGKSKVSVLYKAARNINAELSVECIEDDVENVPVGKLRADVIACCVDNRAARQWINQIACRLQIPWLDVAVDAGTGLVRLNVYRPGPNAACKECEWGKFDYALLEQIYNCRGTRDVPSTSAPAELGAVAAGLLAMIVRKFLNGDQEEVTGGTQVLFDTQHHQVHKVKYQRNPHCRFDHHPWDLSRLECISADTTLGEMLGRFRAKDNPVIRVEGHQFITRLTCLSCARQGRAMLRLSGRFRASQQRCRDCGGRRVGAGLDSFETLALTELSSFRARKRLSMIGFSEGDIFSVETATEQRFYEIGARP